MAYLIDGIDAAPYLPLHALTDCELAGQGIVRVRAEKPELGALPHLAGRRAAR